MISAPLESQTTPFACAAPGMRVCSVQLMVPQFAEPEKAELRVWVFYQKS
jgi:hypothetical protein